MKTIQNLLPFLILTFLFATVSCKDKQKIEKKDIIKITEQNFKTLIKTTDESYEEVYKILYENDPINWDKVVVELKKIDKSKSVTAILNYIDNTPIIERYIYINCCYGCGVRVPLSCDRCHCENRDERIEDLGNIGY